MLQRWIFFLVFASLFSVGCASTDKSVEYSQILRVRSVPAGAEIHHEGKKIGKTPAYVSVRRSYQTDLVLKHKNYPEKKLPLETRYRWGSSFSPNLILLSLAPIGWGVDFATKNAWTYVEPKTQYLDLKAEDEPVKIPRKDWVIAVAPPVDKLDDEELIRDMGNQLTETLKEQYPSSKVIEYKDIAYAFQIYRYYTDQKPPPPKYRVKGFFCEDGIHWR